MTVHNRRSNSPRSLAQKSGKPVSSLMARRDAMRQAAPDWEVPIEAWQRIAPGLQLSDPDDVHVLAAAIAGHADPFSNSGASRLSGCINSWRSKNHTQIGRRRRSTRRQSNGPIRSRFGSTTSSRGIGAGRRWSGS